jgi:hypothetical protein
MIGDKPQEPKKVIAVFSPLAYIKKLEKAKKQKVVIADCSLISQAENNPLLGLEIKKQFLEIEGQKLASLLREQEERRKKGHKIILDFYEKRMSKTYIPPNDTTVQISKPKSLGDLPK